MMNKIEVISTKSYKTDVIINGKMTYESFLHRSVEIRNLRALFAALKIDNIEIFEGEE